MTTLTVTRRFPKRNKSGKVFILIAGLFLLLFATPVSAQQDKPSPRAVKALRQLYDKISSPEMPFKQFLELNAHVYAREEDNVTLAVSTYCTKIANSWCDDFEAGLDQTQYVGAYGVSTAANLYPDPFNNVTYGFLSGAITSSTARQTIVNQSAGNDPVTGIPIVPANGGNQSLRLGNRATGAGFEMIAKTIVVTANTTNLNFSYAVVFQDPNHSFNEQPAFNVRAYDCATGLELANVCNLGNNANVVVSDAQNPFFQSTGGGSIAYRNWTQGQVNLSAHVGKTVIIVFTNKDCSQTGHYGYTYLDNLSTAECAVVPTDYFVVRKLAATSNCGTGQICADYKLPSVGSSTGSVNIALDIYQSGTNTKLATLTSGVLTTGTSYCFSINPALLSGINLALGGFDYALTGTFVLGSFTDVRTDVNTSPPAGYTPGNNNDYFIQCGGPVYYSKSTGDLHDVLTWGLNPDGSGAKPSDFNDSIFQLANRPAVYTMTGDWTVNGGIINIPAARQLQIAGFTLSLTNLDPAGSGTISGSPTSNLAVIGTNGGGIGLNFTSAANMLNNFTLNRTGTGASATVSTPLNILNVLTLTNGTLNTGNLLTLKSTAITTARVAPVTGNISGSVTVERYIPARRAWRLLAAPVGGTSGAANGVATITHSQETVQGAFTTSTGDPRPQSFGTATFSLNAAQTALTFTATITNIDVTGSQTADPNDNLTAAHIHVGAPPGVNAPVRWGFFGAPDNDNNPDNLVITPFGTGVGGTISSTWDLPEGNAGTTLATNLPAILGGLSYFNFHTVQFGGGEIRGQINLVGAGTQTINQAWQEGATTFSANPNPAPGFGTHITQSASNGADGLDFNTAIAMSSLKRHQNPTNTWVPVLNTATTPVSSNAWFIFVRGDRGINMGFNTVAPNITTLRASGPLRTGDQTFPIAASGLTALPNPYASPLNFASIAANNANIANSFTVVDPKLGNTGAFVTVSFNGVSYDVTPAAVSPITELIQSGQGFLVQSAGGAGSITIRETDKSATAATNVFRTAGSPTVSSTNAPVYSDPGTGVGLRVNLQVVNDDRTTSLLDEVFSSYKSNYSEKIDNMDAVKMANNDENLGVEREGHTLILERRPLPTEGDIIPLKLWNLAKKTYLIEINPVNLFGTGLNAYLEDKYLKTSTPISLDKPSQVYFTITSDVASTASNRFQIILSRKITGELTIVPGKSSITAFPNPITGETISLLFSNKPAGTYQATLRNTLGQVVVSKNIQHAGGTATQALPLGKKPVNGVYQLQVSHKEGIINIPVISN